MVAVVVVVLVVSEVSEALELLEHDVVLQDPTDLGPSSLRTSADCSVASV